MAADDGVDFQFAVFVLEGLDRLRRLGPEGLAVDLGLSLPNA